MRLTLFFSRGAGLGLWDAGGMLARETALYRRLQERAGLEVGFVTYGVRDALEYGGRLPGLRILDNRWRLPSRLYESMLPWLHGAWLRGSDVIKTNQTNGAEVARRAARLWRRPLVARCGYMWSEFARRQLGETSRTARQARQLEERVFADAARIVVTTPAMRDDVARRVPAAAARTVVIPNYVDTTRFRPPTGPRAEGEIVFVGRLAPQKNVAALLEAIQPLDCRLTVVGDGELRAELQARFAELGSRVSWRGRVANETLPDLLAGATLFVLPSHYEGHPKALLEAMASGLAVVGANTPGVREVVRHGETGWLCGTDPASLRAAIRELLGRPDLREALGRGARRYVETHCSLERVARQELSLYGELAGGRC